MRIFFALLVVVAAFLYAGSLAVRSDARFAARQVPALEALSQSGIRQMGGIYAGSLALATRSLERIGEWIQSFHRGYRLLLTSLTTISSARFNNMYYVDERSLRSLSMVDSQPNAFLPPIDERLEQLRRHPWIEHVSVRWQMLPLRLQFAIKEAEPWVVAEYNGHSWLVSRKRKLLSPLSSLDDLRLIELAGQLGRIDGLADTPGVESYLASENARFDYATRMLELIEMAKVFEYPIDRYTLRSDGSLVVSARPPAELPDVRLNVHSLSEAEDAAAKLAQVLNDVQSRGEQAREIDMRFLPQVVVR